jgi:hypothetical protein
VDFWSVQYDEHRVEIAFQGSSVEWSS